MPHFTARAAFVAAAASGPLFLASLGLQAFVLGAPEPVPVTVSGLVQLAALMVPVGVVGFLLGVLPNLVGAAAMAALAERHAAARSPLAWIAAGALSGAAIAALFGARDFGSVFPLAATAAACAAICRALSREEISGLA